MLNTTTRKGLPLQKMLCFYDPRSAPLCHPRRGMPRSGVPR